MKTSWILDACCGSRMFWFDKKNKDTVYMDKRKETHVLCDNRSLHISPNIQADFLNMPFSDNMFSLVVFDPPHLKTLGQNSWMCKKYGVLFPSWETDLKQGFDECMRVLVPGGILIFKWNEVEIPLSRILTCFSSNPLFGHTTTINNKTHFITFMKEHTDGSDKNVVAASATSDQDAKVEQSQPSKYFAGVFVGG